MDVFKIIGIAIVALIIIILLKDIKAEYALIVTLLAGILLITLFIDPVVHIISTFNHISETAMISPSIFNLLVKIIGIGYLTDYTSTLCEDFKAKSLGKKVELGGKLIILVLAIPIIKNILTLVGTLLK